ncbi:MAG: hypothetical protein AB2722_18240 [Candidatus Thiodiazotropha sp.]
MSEMGTSKNNLLQGSSAGFGFVALLDALGVSSYDIEAAKKFLGDRDWLLKQLEPLNKKFSEFEEEIPSPTIFSFGDTIIFTWNVGDDRIMKGLVPVAEWLNLAVMLGLSRKMLLRGSLAVGKYIAFENTVIGPAVADAAAWYEDADWFGVTLTPTTEYHLISLIETWDKSNGSLDIEKWFVEYDVPRKGATCKRQWVLSWPYQAWASDKPPSPIGTLATILWDLPKPKGTEDKYRNTFEFYKWYGSNPHARLKKHNKKNTADAKSGAADL